MQGGVVQLKGKVPTYASKIAAEKDVYEVEGVNKVENYLEVEISPDFARPTDAEITRNIENKLVWNSASPESPVGLSYIKHRETGKKILLFVREQNRDEYGIAMSYVFLGEASFVKSYGDRPMSIEWRLSEPIPAGLLKESRKLVG